MLRRTLPIPLLLLAACAPREAARTAAPDTGAGRDQVSRVDSIFASIPDTDAPGCAVGVYRAGRIVLAKGYGMASVEHAAPITSRTPFNVASLSKQFTGYAIQTLARRGKLSLDDDIRRHIPEFPDVGATVTVRHLLHHTSGLRAFESLLMLSGWNRDHPLSRAEALAVILRQRSTGFAPGARYQYGNTNYILLAEIVARSSGRPLDRFLAEEVFGPLGMGDSRLRTDPLAVIPGRAETYWPREGGGYRRNHIWAFAHATGASNVITTVEDLAKWDAEFYDERIGGPGMVSAMYRHVPLLSGDPNAYASGVEMGVHRGLPIVQHTGGAGGDYALVRFPAQRLTTTVLCNVEGGDAYGRALRTAELFLGAALAAEAHTTAAPVTLPESTLTQFTGEYRHAVDREQRVRVEVRRGSLGTVHAGTFYPAIPTGPRTFHDGLVTFEFSEPVAGTPTRLTFERPGMRGTLMQWTELPWRPDVRALAEFEGSFVSPELDVEWTIVLRDGRLALRRPRFTERILEPADRDGFQFEDAFEDETLTIAVDFMRDAAGRPTRFHVTTSRADNIAFTRAGSSR